MIITNSALSGLLVISHFRSNTPSWNNELFVKYISWSQTTANCWPHRSTGRALYWHPRGQGSSTYSGLSPASVYVALTILQGSLTIKN